MHKLIGQEIWGTTSFNIERIALKLVPLAKDRADAAWMTGPSTEGSQNGMPSSMMSDPQESSNFNAFAVVERSGSPANMHGIRATLPCFFNLVNVSAGPTVVVVRVAATGVNLFSERLDL